MENNEPKWITELSFDECYEIFVKTLKLHYKIDFVKDKDFEPIKAVIQYFIQDPEFFKNNAVINNANFDRGLLLIGNTGTLKSYTLRTFSIIWNGLLKQCLEWQKNNKMYHQIDKIWETRFPFTFCSTSQFVSHLKQYDNKGLFLEISRLEQSPNLILDDMKTEPYHHNFGKHNIFDSVICNRSIKRYNIKTFITTNYNGKCICGLSKCKCGFNGTTQNNIKQGLEEFILKYSEQTHDRLYDLFNIIEFNGESKRF